MERRRTQSEERKYEVAASGGSDADVEDSVQLANDENRGHRPITRSHSSRLRSASFDSILAVKTGKQVSTSSSEELSQLEQDLKKIRIEEEQRPSNVASSHQIMAAENREQAMIHFIEKDRDEPTRVYLEWVERHKSQDSNDAHSENQENGSKLNRPGRSISPERAKAAYDAWLERKREAAAKARQKQLIQERRVASQSARQGRHQELREQMALERYMRWRAEKAAERATIKAEEQRQEAMRQAREDERRRQAQQTFQQWLNQHKPQNETDSRRVKNIVTVMNSGMLPLANQISNDYVYPHERQWRSPLEPDDESSVDQNVVNMKHDGELKASSAASLYEAWLDQQVAASRNALVSRQRPTSANRKRPKKSKSNVSTFDNGKEKVAGGGEPATVSDRYDNTLCIERERLLKQWPDFAKRFPYLVPSSGDSEPSKIRLDSTSGKHRPSQRSKSIPFT